MQVTEVANEGLRRAYTVLVPAGDLAAERAKRLAVLGRDLKLPGFRPGKVPPKLVASRYGQAVMTEVLDAQVNEATKQVVSDRGLRPALDPKIEVVNYAPDADLEFKVELEVLPEVPMPDFAAISVERLRAEPDASAIERELAAVADQHTMLADIEEVRPAAPGDVVVCDFTGRLLDAEGHPGEAFPGGSATDMPVEVAGQGFIPGFTEGLLGIDVGETREVRISFPAEYGQAELAGKPVAFAVTAKALKRSIAPAVDDALAKVAGFDDLDALRTRLREGLQRRYDGMARIKVKRALLDALAAQAAFAVPEGMVEAEFAQIWPRVEADIKAGRLDADDQGKDEATLRAEYRAIAERRIRLGLLLSEIGRTNNIQVTNEELARAMREQAMRYPGQEAAVMDLFRKNPQAVEGLRSPIFEEKVVDFLLELARVTDRQVTAEQLATP